MDHNCIISFHQDIHAEYPRLDYHFTNSYFTVFSGMIGSVSRKYVLTVFFRKSEQMKMMLTANNLSSRLHMWEK